jgi:FkbM family methyltransferase
MPHRSLNYYGPSYLKMARLFRNGLSWSHYWRRERAEAVFWNGRRFRMPPGREGLADTVVEMWGSEVYTSGGFYEPAANDLILDIGANVGAFSLWLAQQCPTARVFAVEPSADNFAELARNLAGWPHQVSTMRLAIGGREGQAVISDGGRRSVDHRVEPLVAVPSGADSFELVTLQRLLELVGADRVDLLKMDIEGAEFDVFEQVSQDTLKQIRRLAIEYHDNIRPGTLDLIQRRLSETHDVVSLDGSADGYGILRAVLRQLPA